MITIDGSDAATAKAAFDKLDADGRRALQDPSTRERLALAAEQMKGATGILSFMKETVQGQLAQGILGGLKGQIDAVSGLRRELQAVRDTNVLSSVKNSIAADIEGLARITRTKTSDSERVTTPVQMPRIVRPTEQLEKLLSSQEKRQYALLEKQSRHLMSIAVASERQNEIMAGILALQESLVKAALENSRIQRVVLYFAGLGAALALVALLK